MPPPWVLAVAVSCSVSCFSVIGFVLQSQALRNTSECSKWPRVGELVLSPCWLLGATLQVVPNFFGDLIAYMLAPLSLTAPLSGVSVALNTSIAPRLLGERLHLWPDVPATVLILLGVVITTGTGVHEDHVVAPGMAELRELATRPLALGVFSVLAASLCLCTARQLQTREKIEEEAARRFETPNMQYLLLPAWSAAGAGCVTNVGLKALGELIEGGASSAELLMATLLFVVPPAIMQQQAMNKGLRLYPQTVFFPIYSSLLVLTNTVFGGLFFEEYVALLGQKSCGFFVAGMALVMAGICLFSMRRPQEPEPDLLRETLL